MVDSLTDVTHLCGWLPGRSKSLIFISQCLYQWAQLLYFIPWLPYWHLQGLVLLQKHKRLKAISISDTLPTKSFCQSGHTFFSAGGFNQLKGKEYKHPLLQNSAPHTKLFTFTRVGTQFFPPKFWTFPNIFFQPLSGRFQSEYTTDVLDFLLLINCLPLYWKGNCVVTWQKIKPLKNCLVHYPYILLIQLISFRIFSEMAMIFFRMYMYM